MSGPYRPRHTVTALDEVLAELDGWDESLKDCQAHGGVPHDVVDDLRTELRSAVEVIAGHRCTDHAPAPRLTDQALDRLEALADRVFDRCPERVLHALAAAEDRYRDIEDRALAAVRYWKAHVRARP